jgi:hypothetical protein
MRRARIDAAQQSEVIAELRGAEVARLEILQDALKPVLAQVPADIDLFDTGLVTGERPRFFIDMLGFVEMGRDRRVYRFLQDTRHGRIVLAEGDKLDAIVEAVTGYIARRIIERDQALVSDQTIEQAARAYAEGAARRNRAGLRPAPAANDENGRAAAPRPGPRRRSLFLRLLMVPVYIFGWLMLGGLIAAALYFAWLTGVHWWELRGGG